MNALKHGLRARTIVLPDEKPEDFDEILAGLQNQYQPQNPVEQHLVDQAAIAQWKLVRAEAVEARCFAENPTPKDQAALLDRMTQIGARLERAFFKAYKELEHIKTAREKQAEQAKQPEQPKHPEQSTGKKAKWERPPKFTVRWVKDPETGESEVLYREENGKPVKEFSDASRSPNPPE